MGETLRRMNQDVLRVCAMSRERWWARALACLRSPGLHAILVARFGHWLQKRNVLVRLLLEPWYSLLYRHMRTAWGIEISRSCQIGAGLYIGHFGGIIVSPQAKIGCNMCISQGVTIGVSGRGEKWGAPEIGDDVYIGAGAKVIGKIHVGNNVKIGANTVVYEDIPDNAVAAAPGYRIISYKGNRRPCVGPDGL